MFSFLFLATENDRRIAREEARYARADYGERAERHLRWKVAHARSYRSRRTYLLAIKELQSTDDTDS